MSKLKVTTIANVADSESTDVTNVINGSAKAWVNFNGTGTVAIRESFNVSSITDRGTGFYEVNFTNPMTDSNYAFGGCAGDNSNTFVGANAVTSASLFSIYVRNTSNSVTDEEYISCYFFH
jgi:hypothetical protein